MNLLKELGKLGKLFKSEEEQAEQYAYKREAIKQAKLKGKRRAKADYKKEMK